MTDYTTVDGATVVIRVASETKENLISQDTHNPANWASSFAYVAFNRGTIINQTSGRVPIMSTEQAAARAVYQAVNFAQDAPIGDEFVIQTDSERFLQELRNPPEDEKYIYGYLPVQFQHVLGDSYEKLEQIPSEANTHAREEARRIFNMK